MAICLVTLWWGAMGDEWHLFLILCLPCTITPALIADFLAGSQANHGERDRRKDRACLSKPKGVSFPSAFPLKNLPGVWEGLEVLGGLLSHTPHSSWALKLIFMPRPMCPTVRV